MFFSSGSLNFSIQPVLFILQFGFFVLLVAFDVGFFQSDLISVKSEGIIVSDIMLDCSSSRRFSLRLFYRSSSSIVCQSCYEGSIKGIPPSRGFMKAPFFLSALKEVNIILFSTDFLLFKGNESVFANICDSVSSSFYSVWVYPSMTAPFPLLIFFLTASHLLCSTVNVFNYISIIFDALMIFYLSLM